MCVKRQEWVKKVFCRIGAWIATYSVFFWLGFSSDDALGVTLKEVSPGLATGAALMLPELCQQLRDFFSSGRRFED